MGEVGYSNFPFEVTPGTNILQQVGFNPLFAIVSNYSPFYIYFPDGLSYCPPWTAGAVIQLQHATQARASWDRSPFGTQDTALPIGPYSATISFTNDPRLATVGGSPITDPTVQGSELSTVSNQSVTLVAGVNNNFVSFVNNTKLLFVTVSVDAAGHLILYWEDSSPIVRDGILSIHTLASQPHTQYFGSGLLIEVLIPNSITNTSKIYARHTVNTTMKITYGRTALY